MNIDMNFTDMTTFNDLLRFCYHMDSNQKLLDLSSSDQPLDCYSLFKWEYTLMGEVGLKMVCVCVCVCGEDEGEGVTLFVLLFD